MIAHNIKYKQIPKDIIHLRLQNQLISHSTMKSAKETVEWMGAMQAQDLNWARWAIGLRLPGSTRSEVDKALDEGQVLRTHVLRPTWHFVSPEAISLMLDLTAPSIRQAMKSRHNQLQITGAILAKFYGLITKALEEQGPVTRDEIREITEKARIETGDNRLAHLLVCAELDRVICSGPFKSNKPTYAHFEKRVTQRLKLSREEANARLARSYFRSHGPATLRDFTCFLPTMSTWSAIPTVVPLSCMKIRRRLYPAMAYSGRWF